MENTAQVACIPHPHDELCENRACSADPFQTVFSVPSVHGGCGSYHAGGHGLLWCQVIEVKRTVSLALRDVARIAVKRDDIKILCAFIWIRQYVALESVCEWNTVSGV